MFDPVWNNKCTPPVPSLPESPNWTPSTLSSWRQAKCPFKVAITFRRLLLFDEPNAAVDAETAQALFERYAAAAHDTESRHAR